MELAARLAVLLACAAAAGALFVLLVSPPRRDRDRPAADLAEDLRARWPTPGSPQPIPGAVPLALGAFILVAGGSAFTGAGVAGGEGWLHAVRALGIALLIAAGALAALHATGRRATGTGPGAAVSLAWLGAGMALASPLAMVVAVCVVLILGVRVAARA